MQISINCLVVETKLDKIYIMIKYKFIALLKVNTTPITLKKKIFVMRVGSEGLRRSIFGFGLVYYSALKI